MQHGPAVLAPLTDGQRAAAEARMGGGFTAALLAVAAFAALNALLAWTLPLRLL